MSECGLAQPWSAKPPTMLNQTNIPPEKMKIVRVQDLRTLSVHLVLLIPPSTLGSAPLTEN